MANPNASTNLRRAKPKDARAVLSELPAPVVACAVGATILLGAGAVLLG